MKALTFLARRFVAGEEPEAAIAAGLALQRRGISATFDLLGEDVDESEKARRSAACNHQLLRLIPPPVDRNISIKLSTLGLDIAEELCLELTSGVLETAREVGGFVRIDMEGSRYTQRTLDVFHRLRRTYDNVGIVLQSYLFRTEDDVKQAIARGDRVRLCKGAYQEPSEIAWTKMDDIRASFRRCARLLLAQGRQPALATHDESLIQDALSFCREQGVGPRRFEFQMLYGLRPRRWDELVAASHAVRIYVPYGTHWMPYFYRRLRERRENVWFVLRSLLGG
ncbi:MAG TPA: proline dehydrogenase family protein [Vicinamibacteria bacterium]|nr:proline dehydrogenase family protein [Vicinamibacteria bacterium]